VPRKLEDIERCLGSSGRSKFPVAREARREPGTLCRGSAPESDPLHGQPSRRDANSALEESAAVRTITTAEDRPQPGQVAERALSIAEGNHSRARSSRVMG
jgi:hypothetical protein